MRLPTRLMHKIRDSLPTARQSFAIVATAFVFGTVLETLLPRSIHESIGRSTNALLTAVLCDVREEQVSGKPSIPAIQFDPAQLCCARVFVGFPSRGRCVSE